MLRNLCLLLWLLFYHSLINAQVFDPGFKSPLTAEEVVFGIALQQDGKILIGGNLEKGRGEGRNLIRLHSNGTIDTTFQIGAGFNGFVNDMVLQPDGKIIAGGGFTKFNNHNSANLVRLMPDGSLDTTFRIGTGVEGSWNSVQTIKFDGTGKIYVGGAITRFNGKTANMLVRLHPDGSLDESFQPTKAYTGMVVALAIQPDNKVLVGGTIRKSVGPAVLIRLNPDGELDTSFKVSSTETNSINSILVLPDQRILAGGDFSRYDGKDYAGLVRLEPNGIVDEQFDIGNGFQSVTGGIFSYPIYKIAQVLRTTEGKILVSGYFHQFNGTNTDGIVQLNADGSLDHTFQACERDGLQGRIYDMRLEANGKILFGGYFGAYRNARHTTNLFRLLNQPGNGGSRTVLDFDFIQLGREVTFINKSKNASAFDWDFGDGNSSTLTNPVHTFPGLGRHTVRLQTSGLCFDQLVLTRRLDIQELQSIHPKSGGNAGMITLAVTGAVLAKASSVRLSGNGMEIRADTFFTDQHKSITYVSFNLKDKKAGLYDFVVVSDGITRKLPAAFTIEQDGTYELYADLSGRDAVRSRRKEKFQLSFGNRGNTDALAVPLLISGIPKNAIWSLQATIDTLLDDGTSVPLGIYDEDSSQVIPLLIPRIPAKSSFSVDFYLELPANGSDLSLNSAIFQPLITDPLDSTLTATDTRTAVTVDCLEKLMEKAFDEATELLVPRKCLQEARKLLYQTMKEFIGNNGTFDPTHPNFFRAYTKHLYITGKTGLVCAKDIFPGSYKRFYNLFLKRYLKRDDLKEDLKTIGVCVYAIVKAYYESSKKIQVVTSIDPNEKAGITTNSDKHHVKGIAPLTYQIFFENKDTAKAPAQEVLILDTLDKSKFDLSTFQLLSFGFGARTRISVPGGLQAYAADVPVVRPGKGNLLVRVVAKLDTAKGILEWRFISLDPSTKELIDDPLDGFLYPNVQSPEGEGFISYSVGPFRDLAHGTEIRNKASIYFDINDPIVTNDFLNVIDKISPQSNVAALPAETRDTSFTLRWGGTDNGAGIRYYDIYVAVNRGAYQLWKSDVTGSEAIFEGRIDSIYQFYSIAKDFVGNEEPVKTIADAETVIKGSVVTSITEVRPDYFKFWTYPNPTKGGTSFEFVVPAIQQVRLVLTDLSGREVTEIVNRRFTRGKHRLYVDLSHLQGGLYLCVLQSGNKITSTKVLKY